MHKLKEKLRKELYEYSDRIEKNPHAKLSASEVGYIHMLTDTIKNIDKMEMLENGGHSYATEFMGEGRMRGTSYGGHNYEGDHSQRYYRDSDSSSYRDGNSYDGGYSERRHRDSMGRYSREDSKEHMMKALEDARHSAEDPKHREVLERAMSDLGRM